MARLVNPGDVVAYHDPDARVFRNALVCRIPMPGRSSVQLALVLFSFTVCVQVAGETLLLATRQVHDGDRVIGDGENRSLGLKMEARVDLDREGREIKSPIGARRIPPHRNTVRGRLPKLHIDADEGVEAEFLVAFTNLSQRFPREPCPPVIEGGENANRGMMIRSV